MSAPTTTWISAVIAAELGSDEWHAKIRPPVADWPTDRAMSVSAGILVGEEG